METPIAQERREVRILRENLPDAVLKVKEWRDDTFICVKKDSIRDVMKLLKEHPELDYAYFCECLGVDYSTWPHERDLEGRFEVVYNLMTLTDYSRIYIKLAVNEGETVPTVRDIYVGAEYPEREIQDLYGVMFEGNEPIPGQRFLLPDDWVGFPLRKEYPLGGEDVVFDGGTTGPAVEDISMPHAGESFEGKTGTGDVSGR